MKWNRVSKFSAYARAESHLVQHTLHGALVTTCGVLLALYLFISEVVYTVTPYETQKMEVDTARNELLRIHLNFTLPALPCQVVSLDVVDVSGQRASDVSLARNGELHKWRLDAAGQRRGLGEYVAPHPPDALGALGFTLRKTPQEIRMMDEAMDAHEGCNIVGWLDVQRVAGNFHISVHADTFFNMHKTQEELAEQLRAQLFRAGDTMRNIELTHDVSRINVSHIIHHVGFGPSFPGQVNPLDGSERIVTDSGTFKYFLKIVPTTYHRLDGSILATNQYSLTEYFTPTTKAAGALQMPAIFVLYDLSPIAVTITAQRRSFMHLLVRICAVVGGVFAVTGMMDRWVHRLVTSLTAKPHP